MARNKYPEQTIERILNVSAKLFWEKGYENTSIQDILDELKDLSKGAIYHHFKSKEAIFDAIASKEGENNIKFFNEIKNNNKLNGVEKLRKFIMSSALSETTKKIVNASPNLLDNPKFLAIQLKRINDIIAPDFIFPIIKEGIEDGSINTDKPYELAEAITILVNIWLNPLIFGANSSAISKKCELINEFLEKYNILLFDENSIQKFSQF